MGRLYRYNVLQILRNRADLFWTLVFPIIMATLFYITFGSSQIENMKLIPAAVVEGGNQIFEAFLDGLDGEVLALSRMDDKAAQKALKDGKVNGIFYSEGDPSLAVAGTQINESILEMLLNGYRQNQGLAEMIGAKNPLGLIKASKQMAEQTDFIEAVDAGGSTQDSALDSFFSLVAMTCLFGALMGVESAIKLRADQSALAARRSVTPTQRFRLIASEMLAVFTVQFANICILLLYLHFGLGIGMGRRWPLLLPVCALGTLCGVAAGFFLGGTRLKEGIKIGLVIAGTLFLCFLSGMMYSGMKAEVERFAPIVNRLSPAALIADAFYSVSVYENSYRYGRSLILLALITILLTAAAYLRMRRERYDSI